jgi:membrane fusion protein (multidrug efflux system)
MFVNVEVLLPKKESHVSVPLTAVVHAPYGDSVFIVESKDGGKVARQQFVRVGRARGDFVAVLDGVKAKEEVVVQGAFKLRNNAAVAVDNSKRNKPALDPRPDNR